MDGVRGVARRRRDSLAVLGQFSNPKITSVCCGWNNKGVAVSEDKVFIGQLDGQLVALDRATGKVAWSIQASGGRRTSRSPQPRCTSMARSSSALPAAIAGRAAGQGVRREGRPSEVTFYTISGTRRTGPREWPKDNDAWKYGGAAIWQTPAVDPELVSCISRPVMPRPTTTARSGPETTCMRRLCWRLTSRREVSLALSTGAPRHLGLRRRQPRRPHGRERRRTPPQGDC